MLCVAFTGYEDYVWAYDSDDKSIEYLPTDEVYPLILGDKGMALLNKYGNSVIRQDGKLYEGSYTVSHYNGVLRIKQNVPIDGILNTCFITKPDYCSARVMFYVDNAPINNFDKTLFFDHLRGGIFMFDGKLYYIDATCSAISLKTRQVKGRSSLVLNVKTKGTDESEDIIVARRDCKTTIFDHDITEYSSQVHPLSQYGTEELIKTINSWNKASRAMLASYGDEWIKKILLLMV